MVTLMQDRPTLGDVDFNRRDCEDRPLRPIPPGRDRFSPRWLPSRHYLFGPWQEIEPEVPPSDFTRTRDDMFWQADEHIIPIVDLLHREGSSVIRPMFEQALTGGIDSVTDAPPELVEFFAHATERPSWLDLKAADRGRILISSASMSAQRLIGGWALFETAMTGDISAATGATGRFKRDAVRRHVETMRMFALVNKPDLHRPDSEAFQTITRVRLMHGLASRGLRRAWGTQQYLDYGEPIAATSLLAFGNGPLLTRLIDHRFGRRLSARDLDDIAMFTGLFGRTIGAPDRLRARDGKELVRSLDYIYARGGDPSGWREELMQSMRQPVDAIVDTYLSPLPEIVRSRIADAGCKALSVSWIAPLSPVFGRDEVKEFLDGAPEFKISLRLHGELFERTAALNARMAGLRDRMPGMALARRQIYRNGPPGIDGYIGAMEAFAKRYHDLALAYSSHDGSTAGKGLGAPRLQPV